MRAAILDEMRKYIFRDRIVDARQKRLLSFKKAVALTPEFEELWNRISRKTAYAVEFETDELIKQASSRLKDMERIRPRHNLNYARGTGGHQGRDSGRSRPGGPNDRRLQTEGPPGHPGLPATGNGTDPSYARAHSQGIMPTGGLPGQPTGVHDGGSKAKSTGRCAA